MERRGKRDAKKDDKNKKEYIFSLNGKEKITIFRTGIGGSQEWTGISKGGGFGFPSFRVAVIDMMGWNRFQEYMKGRKRV